MLRIGKSLYQVALLPLLLSIALLACDEEVPGGPEADTGTAGVEEMCDPDDGGIELPPGFCASVFADELGRARHLVVRDNGDVYVHLRTENEGGSTVALKDTTGDGRADVREYFGDYAGTGIDIRDGYLYVSSDMEVVRYPLPSDSLVPDGSPDVIATGFLEQGQHATKSFAFDNAGNLYVNVGAPSNACQEQMRTAGSPGQDPCPQLERQAGIWRFDADATGQEQVADGERYATGLRNSVALAWHDGALYAVPHGRDQLHGLFPDLYTQEENAELPAEQFVRVSEGSDFGWPYCYYDQNQDQKVLAPEYGGDGEEIGRCADMEDPLLAFPGHYAPNDLLFYTGELFPSPYQGGAFVAHHGSWNRAPLPQEGYMVAFVPFSGGEPTGEWEVFADGFKGVETLDSPGEAEYRPTGLAQGPDGALYVSDSVDGRIWRITYVGE